MHKKYLPFIFVLTMLGSGIEIEIAAPSFPNMKTYFQVSEEVMGHTITLNLIGFCLGALIYGPISESYGRRKTMILGNMILSASSIACLLSVSFNFLLIMRFFQGIGAATSAVLTSAMIADTHDMKASAKLYGTMNAFFTIIMALSPILGGIVNHYIGWRGNYGLISLICTASLFVIILFLPETKRNLSSFNPRKIFNDYYKILSDLNFLCSSIVPSISYGCYLGFITCAAFLYMGTFKLTIFEFVIHQGIITAAFAITSIFAASITKQINNYQAVFLGTLINLASTIFLLLASIIFPLSANLVTFFISCYSIGSAIIYPIVFTLSLELYPSLKGTASSAIMFLRYIVCALIVGIMCYSYNGSSISISVCSLAAATITAFLTFLLARKNFFDK